MFMHNKRLMYTVTGAMASCLCFLLDPEGAAQSTMNVSEAQASVVQPTTARVWFLRQSDPLNGNVQAAAPMIFANGSPLGRSLAGTVFYRDVTPGAYTFTVEPYGGLPTGQADTVRLAPGTQTYLQVQWLPSWQVGYPEATWSDAPNTFGILTMSAHLAQAYIPTMTNLGQR
jgi:hypothetical protein